jgi:hypothetical protein
VISSSPNEPAARGERAAGRARGRLLLDLGHGRLTGPPTPGYDAALVNEPGIESTGGFELALELTAKAFRPRVQIAQVPATWRDRTAGESRFRVAKWLPKYLSW